jgi:hypothetical protein
MALTDARTVERNTVIAVGATLVWLFANQEKIKDAKWGVVDSSAVCSTGGTSFFRNF